MAYVFLFDRKTGKPLFPINEVPVSTVSQMPGEKPWPTQPIPVKPAPFSRQGFKPEYFSTITPEVTEFIKGQIRENNFNTGIYEPPSLQGSIIVPAAHGGANWGGASFNPNSGVLFVNAVDLPWILKLKEIKSLSADNDQSGANLFKMYCSSCHGADKKGTNFGPDITLKIADYSRDRLETIIKRGAEPMPSFQHLPQQQIDAITRYLKGMPQGIASKEKVAEGGSISSEPYGFSGYNFFMDQNGIPAIKPPFGTLNAIDLNSGDILWQVPLGEDKKLVEKGFKNSGLYNRGGGIATAGGLIFIGATGDNMFRAFDQLTGKVVWEIQLRGSATSIPATYSVGQKQYITVAVSPNPSKNYKGGYVTFGID